MQNLLVVMALAAGLLVAPATAQNAGMDPAEPLKIARVLAARYPAQPIMSYIPALAWSGGLRLSAMTGEPQWREKAAKDMQAFISGQTPAIAEPYRLTSLAGAFAFYDAAALDKNADAGALAQKVAAFVADAPTGLSYVAYCEKRTATKHDRARVPWTWASDGGWVAPDLPRWQFATQLTRVPVLYKVYIPTSLPDEGDEVLEALHPGFRPQALNVGVDARLELVVENQ